MVFKLLHLTSLTALNKIELLNYSAYRKQICISGKQRGGPSSRNIIPATLKKPGVHCHPSKHSVVSPMTVAGYTHLCGIFSFLLSKVCKEMCWEMYMLGSSGPQSITFWQLHISVSGFPQLQTEENHHSLPHQRWEPAAALASLQLQQIPDLLGNFPQGSCG